jgi:hypothetical protein
MAKIKYSSKYETLHTTIGVLDGVKSIEPSINPYYMEEFDFRRYYGRNNSTTGSGL